MKHIYRILLFAAVLVAFQACGGKETKAPEGGQMKLDLTFEDSANASKSYLSGNTICWGAESVDKILFVFDSKGGKNVFNRTSPASTGHAASFEGEIPEDSRIKFALWSGLSETADQSSVEGDIISGLAVKNPQTINNTSSFDNTANIAVLKGRDKVLKNVFGYIKYVIPADASGNAAVKSITFSADEYISGSVDVDYSGDEPLASIVGDGGKSITLNTRWRSTKYEAGTVYMVVPPGVYHNCKLTVTTFKNGATSQDAETNEPFTVRANGGTVTVVRSRYTDGGTVPTSATDPVDPPPPEEDVLAPESQWVKLLDKCNPVCLEGNYLYAAADGIVYVLDVTNPLSPQQVGTQGKFKGSPRQICVYNNKLFLTARETGVWIFDLTDPTKPTLLSRYDSVELATGVEAAGNCLFIGQRQMGVEFVDVSNPAKPQHIQAIKTPESQSVFYVDGYLYSGEWTSGEVTIFDASNLGDIRKITTVPLWGYGDGIWVLGNRLYASTGHNPKNDAKTQDPTLEDGDGHGVEIWDISNKAAPTRISRVKFHKFYKSGSDWWLNRPSGDGKTLFCGDVYNGLYVVDITNEANPKILQWWIPGGVEANIGNNHSVNSLAVGDGVLYLSCNGLWAIKCPRANRSVHQRGNSPTGESARYNYPTPSSSKFHAWIPTRRGAVRDAAISPDGSALFVGCGQAGLATIKLNSNGEPYAVAEKDIPFAGGVSVLGNRLYVSEAEKGVGVYKIGSDLSLTFEEYILEQLYKGSSNYYRYQYSYWLTTPNDKYLVSANRSSGWQFIAIGGTSSKPTYTYRNTTSWNVNYNKYISEKVCADDKLPYATRSGLRWADLSSTSNVSFTEFASQTNSLSEGVTEFKDGTALLTTSKKFKTVTSGTATILQSSAANDNYSGIPRWDGGDRVLVCSYPGMRIGVFNLSDVTNPREIFVESTAAYPEPGIFWNGKAVVPCGYQGLLIEKTVNN